MATLVTRSSFRLTCFLIVLLSLPVGELHAQSPRLNANDIIRFTAAPEGHAPASWVGRFRRVSGDTLFYVLKDDVESASTESRTISLSRVRDLEVHGGGHSHGAGGLMFGAVAGGVFGGLLGGICIEAGCSPPLHENPRVIGALMGGAVGAALGYLIGTVIRTSGWTPVRF
jgi:hypothetical protein